MANPLRRETELRVGVALPQGPSSDGEVLGRLRRVALFAEEAGFDSLWTADTVRGSSSALEPLTALVVAATATRRIRLGVAVLILPLRAPVEVARTCATIDQLSRGRLELGVGLGGDPSAMWSVGLRPAQRISRFIDGVAVIRALWSGAPATVRGVTLSIEDWASLPRPVQRPNPPIWFGAKHPKAIQRAAAMADGWIGAGTATSKDFVQQLTVANEAAAARIAQGAFHIGKRLYVGIDTPGRPLREPVSKWFSTNYGDSTLADRVAVVGPPSKIIEAISELRELGVDHVIIHPVVDEERQLRVLTAEVLPSLRAAATRHTESPG